MKTLFLDLLSQIQKIIKKSSLLNILLLLLATFYITFPFRVDEQILKMNDMAGNSVNLVFIKQTILEYHVFPQWNHLLNYGTPLVADPLNAFFNPIVSIPIMLFPLETAIKLIYFISIFLSGLFFYLLLKRLKVNNEVNMLLALTYMSSGFMVARIYAGHLEKIITYPLYPLLFWSILHLLKKGGIVWIGTTSLILSLYILSGAIYEFLYAFITVSLIGLFYVIKFIIVKDKVYKKQILDMFFVVILFPLFSAFKILPLIEISSYFDHVRDPFSGSHNFYSIIYNLFLPHIEIFKKLNLSEQISLPYFWWEHFAYVGPLPLIALLLIPMIIRKRMYSYMGLFIFLFISLISFLFLGSPFSPFNWFFKYIPFLEQFRIPSRIFIVLVPVILVLTAFVLAYFYRTRNQYIKILIVILLFLNFIDVSRAFYSKVGSNEFIYTPPISDLEDLLNKLNERDKGFYYIGQHDLWYLRSPIDVAVQNEQRLNHNYGFMLSKSYSLASEKDTGIYPKYFIYPQGVKPPEFFAYEEVLTGSEGSKVYKNDIYTAYTDVYTGPASKLKYVSSKSAQIKDISVEPDKIRVIVDSKQKGNTLLVLESYAPGWKATVDDKSIQLLKNDFLNIPLQEGEHVYIFTYNNQKFIFGLLITFIAIILWALSMLKFIGNNRILYKTKK